MSPLPSRQTQPNCQGEKVVLKYKAEREKVQGSSNCVTVYFTLLKVPKVERAVSIGVFDGVHLGHRALLRSLVTVARQNGWRSLALTFANHPQSVLRPPAPPLLTTVDERLSLLSETGIDEILVLPFTEELSRYSPQRFCEEVLVNGLGCRALVVGHDFALGHRREGTVPRLRELGEQLGFRMEIVSAVTNAGELVSSSCIRNLLLDGKVERANELLGKPYRLRGVVVAGAGRGKALGFPTVNLQGGTEKLLPMHGVYAGWMHLPSGIWGAAAYIGVRPTFGETLPAVEAHLLDFEGKVSPGTPAALELVAFIRPDQSFDRVDDLVAQIRKDLVFARTKLQGSKGTDFG